MTTNTIGALKGQGICCFYAILGKITGPTVVHSVVSIPVDNTGT